MVDEMMVVFKGRSLLKQYMPTKPHKWRFKIWGRSGISGFLYDFDVYQGRKQGDSKPFEYGMGGDVVMSLTSTLPPNRNFKVFVDNFFTSLPLLSKLKEKGIFYVATIRKNRMKNCPLKEEKRVEEERKRSMRLECREE